jgi:hypothetical protein
MMTSTTSRRFGGRLLTCLAAVAFASISADASGQQTVPSTKWQRGTTLAGFVGAASASSDTNAAAGGALGWEITPHFTLEGRGTWFREGHGSSAFSAVLGALIPLLPARSVVPFASAGVGMYRAMFNSDSSNVPAFYRDRMTFGTFGTGSQAFEDFLLAFGGGADVFVASHFAIRPEVTVQLVTTQSDRRAVAVYGVHLAYHFEAHATP